MNPAVQTRAPYSPIADYAIIGDCRCAALVSRSGSIDWLCLPRFDSPSIFGAILDANRGGRFSIRPSAPFTSCRSYAGETNVLQTTFETERGLLRLTDFMPVSGDHRKLSPRRQILRQLECLKGEVEVEIGYRPRPDYAREDLRLTDRGPLGFYGEWRDSAFILRADLPLHLGEDRRTVDGRHALRQGDRHWLSFSMDQGEPAVIPALGASADESLSQSLSWWLEWAGRCTYRGPFRKEVVRSVLVLKLMSYCLSGAVVAAPTTSLPEKIGGVRNWDYRYCWLRDASMTLRAFFRLGYMDEGMAFLSWMIHTTSLTRPELQIIYNVYGETRLEERELSHLEGYAGSRPVRIGNGAEEQLQMDIYGEVLDSAFEFARGGGPLDAPTRKMLLGFGETVRRRWREPDEGIWEIRAGRRHHTHSKALCWVALDRLIRMGEQGCMEVPGREELIREREAIRRDIEEHAFSERLRSYTSSFGEEEVDVSLLLLPLYDYVEASAPRMRSTYDHIRKRLGENGLLYRYRPALEDGLPPGEGAFAIGSFWAVQCRAQQQGKKSAEEDFRRVLSCANDVGLFAEEIDPQTGAALGNFPQAYTHVGLINAALALAEPAPG